MLSEVKVLVEDLKKRWLEVQKVKTGWLSNSTTTFKLAIPFLIKAIDELMVLVSKFSLPGVDKKVLVLQAISELYDSIVTPILPFWVKPFSSTIKDIVVNVGVAAFVDFLVTRLRENKPV